MDDDPQFNASLDALLESESLHDASSAAPTDMANLHPVTAPSSASTHPSNSSLQQFLHSQQSFLGESNPALAPQGLLTGARVGGLQASTSATGNSTFIAPPSRHISYGNVTQAAPQAAGTSVAAHLPFASGHLSPSLNLNSTSTSTHVGSSSGPAIAQRGITLPASSTFAVHNPVAPPAAPGNDGGGSSAKPPAAAAAAADPGAKKRGRDVCEVSEDEDDRHRRRYERNMREQQRSHRITQQIAELREVLAAANIQFKPDKYSTLVTVGEYIKQLQKKSAMLDLEHKRLVDTIAKTNEIVSGPYNGSATSSVRPDGSLSNPDAVPSGDGLSNDNDTENAEHYVRDIDYRTIFSNCGIPLAVASIDGRFIDCNKEFEVLTGFTRKEILPQTQPSGSSSSSTGSLPGQTTFSSQQSTTSTDSSALNLSLFNLLSKEDMESVFVAMSEMLKQPSEHDIDLVESTSKNTNGDRWTSIVSLCRKPNQQIRLNVSLVRTPSGRARFFDCAFTPEIDVSIASS